MSSTGAFGFPWTEGRDDRPRDRPGALRVEPAPARGRAPRRLRINGGKVVRPHVGEAVIKRPPSAHDRHYKPVRTLEALALHVGDQAGVCTRRRTTRAAHLAAGLRGLPDQGRRQDGNRRAGSGQLVVRLLGAVQLPMARRRREHVRARRLRRCRPPRPLRRRSAGSTSTSRARSTGRSLVFAELLAFEEADPFTLVAFVLAESRRHHRHAAGRVPDRRLVSGELPRSVGGDPTHRSLSARRPTALTPLTGVSDREELWLRPSALCHLQRKAPPWPGRACSRRNAGSGHSTPRRVHVPPLVRCALRHAGSDLLEHRPRASGRPRSNIASVNCLQEIPHP